jgi:D-sedoheptulose 7-phosphate isomerase
MNGAISCKWLIELNEKISKTECMVSGKKTDLAAAFDLFANIMLDARDKRKSVWWVGNGGSAAACSHLSQDMLNKLKVRSFVLTDASLITCMSNDFGYANVYARPLETLSNDGDVMIAISSSGKSENILLAAQLALRKKMSLITLSGFEPINPLRQLNASISFYLPSHSYGQVEIGHEAILHSIIEVLALNSQKN